MLLRQRSCLEKFGQQIVFALGHQFHQLFVRFFRRFRISGGNFLLGRFPVAIRHKYMRLHVDQIDHPREILLTSQRQMDRNRGTPEAFPDALHRTVETGAVAVQFINDNGTRQFPLIRVGPHLFRLRLHARHRIHHDNQRIRRNQRRVRIVGEKIKSRRV